MFRTPWHKVLIYSDTLFITCGRQPRSMIIEAMSSDDSATAYQAWQERWATEEGRAPWIEPEPDVVAVADRLRGKTPIRALDLGSGVGRHALYLAGRGFTVSALDASQRGIDITREEAKRLGLTIDLEVGKMTQLSYPDRHFDYVLSWNVIYHGDGGIVRRCIAEIHRVLRPGGIFQGTLLSKRNGRYGLGREIAPDTFVETDTGDGSDKVHPHYYCNAADTVDLFRDFEIVSLVDRERGGPAAFHWHLIAERT